MKVIKRCGYFILWICIILGVMGCSADSETKQDGGYSKEHMLKEKEKSIPEGKGQEENFTANAKKRKTQDMTKDSIEKTQKISEVSKNLEEEENQTTYDKKRNEEKTSETSEKINREKDELEILEDKGSRSFDGGEKRRQDIVEENEVKESFSEENQKVNEENELEIIPER